MAAASLQAVSVQLTALRSAVEAGKGVVRARQVEGLGRRRGCKQKLHSAFVESVEGLRFQERSAFCKAGASALVTKAAVGTVVTEPATNIKFASSLTAPGGSKELTLLGAGVREKKILVVNVKVYAVAFYIDSAFAGLLAEFKGKDLSGDQAFFKALAEAPVEKSIQIVLARDVDGQTFFNALGESLAPRLGGEGEQALASFGDVLKIRNLKQNTGIYLTLSQPSTLQVGITEDATTLSVPTESVATIESAALLKALLDVYLGAEPVSDSAKAAIAKGAAGLL